MSRLHLREQVVGELSNLYRKVLLDLREPGHHGCRLRESSALEGATEEQRGGQPVAGHVAVEADQMTGLLAAQDGVLPPKRLEHVAVADVRGDDADPVVGHQPVEAEVGHHGDNDRVDLKVEREDREDLVAVDDPAVAVHGEHAVAVSVEGHAEIRAGRDDLPLQEAEVGGAAADVDVRPVRLVRKRQDLGAKPLERGRGDPRVRAVRAVDGDREASQLRSEPVENMLRVAVGRDADSIDRPRSPRGGSSSRASISSSAASVSFCPAPSKNLIPLYSGGLCEAETTMPRSSESRATAGVGSTPPSTALPPTDATPAAKASSSIGPDPRVSRPMNARPRPDQSAAARPSRSTRSGVRFSPTTPRTPSVPKYLRTAGFLAGASERRG